MAAPTPVVTGATVKWGIPTLETYGAGFLVADVSDDATLKTKEIPGETGATEGFVEFDTTYTRKYSIRRTSGTAPTVGTSLTVNSVVWRIVKVGKKWTPDNEEVTDVDVIRFASFAFA